MMKKTIHTITLCIILTIFTLSTGACDRKEPEKQQIKQEVSEQEVSKQEAPKDMSTANLFKTKCTKCHEVKRAEDMHASKESFVDIIKEMIKKGAEIDDQQGKEIAEFLATPSRFLLKEKCSKCHTLDRIYEGLNAYYFVSPQIPMSPGM